MFARKYHSLLSVGLVSALIIGMVGFCYYKNEQIKQRLSSIQIKRPINTAQKETIQLKDVIHLEKLVNQCQGVKINESIEDPILTLFEDRLSNNTTSHELHKNNNHISSQTNQSKSQNNQIVSTAYILTFTFISDIKRACIINGAYFNEGSRLPNGAYIYRIEMNRVQIEQEGKLVWIDSLPQQSHSSMSHSNHSKQRKADL